MVNNQDIQWVQPITLRESMVGQPDFIVLLHSFPREAKIVYKVISQSTNQLPYICQMCLWTTYLHPSPL